MLFRFRTKWLVVVLAACGLIFTGALRLRADDEKTEAKAADDKKTDGKKTDDTEKDPFAVPDGTPEELLKFITKTEQARPKQFRSRDDVVDFVKKSRGAISKAADKILAANAKGKTRVKAIEAKFEALGTLTQFGDTDANKQLEDFLGEIKGDKEPEVKQLVKFFDLKSRMAKSMDDPEAAAKLWDDIKTELKSAPSKNLVGLASTFARRKEQEDPEAAGKVLTELAGILSKSTDPAILAQVKRFEGAARRLTLMGKQMEITGTMLDGTMFDQGTLKGKVVLVDFWATWCGPCRAELPNVKENYKKYHSKGFEVVGVSLDQSADPLKKFIEKEEITWPILFPKDKKDQFWNNPLAVHYGVSGIPCVILMNQKGEVVSLNARGPALGEKLEELLGKVEEEKEEKSDKTAAKEKDEIK